MPGSDPLGVDLGSRAKANIIFLKYDHVAYQIKANDTCINMVANISPLDTPSTSGWGSKIQEIYFSESSHVDYQIKGN